MPGISILETSSLHSSFGDYSATVDYNHTAGFSEDGSAIPTAYNILDTRIIFGRDGWTRDRTRYQLTFAVFNFFGIPNAVLLPRTCIAIPLKCNAFKGEVLNKGGHTRIQTPEPIVFELCSKRTKDTTKFWWIKKDEFAKHGMQLINMYL